MDEIWAQLVADGTPIEIGREARPLQLRSLASARDRGRGELLAVALAVRALRDCEPGAAHAVHASRSDSTLADVGRRVDVPRGLIAYTAFATSRAAEQNVGGDDHVAGPGHFHQPVVGGIEAGDRQISPAPARELQARQR